MAIINSNSIESLVQTWLKAEEQGERFPVLFDDAWAIAGYSRKDSAKRKLPKHALDKLFHIEIVGTGGCSEERIFLSIQGFIVFLVNSRTIESRNILLNMFSYLKGLAFGQFTNTSNPCGFIYLVKQSINNYYKIGKSKNPYKRLQTLQTGSPLELVIVERYFSMDCERLEKALHDYYSAYWVRGEWFEFSDEIIGDFLAIVRMLDGEIELLCNDSRQLLIGE